MRKTLVAALLVCFAASARAEEAKPSPFTFALHGFVSMSGYVQDGALGLSEGQQSLFATTPRFTTDKIATGFDVRQSRFNFSVKGPQVFAGATPSAVLEFDFMQGFGAGAYGNVSLLNRMRLAYSELNWGNNRLAFGQLNDLLFAQAPYSLSHIAFPLGFETGNVGWRRPGFWGFHTLPIEDMKLEFAWEIGRSQWSDGAALYTAGTGAAKVDTTAGIGNNTYNAPNGISDAEASGIPAFEGRLTLTGKYFTVWGGGHWNRVDLNGVNTAGGNKADVIAGGGGLKITMDPITLAGCGFYGKNTGPLVGNLVQFSGGAATAGAPAAATPFQDVKAWGFWSQLGVNLTKEFSLWGFYGMQKLDQDQAKAAKFARLQNNVSNVMAVYREGGYAVSAEWLNFKTKTATYTGAVASTLDVTNNQYMLTANYFF